MDQNKKDIPRKVLLSPVEPTIANNKSPTLSICIPTRNQPEAVRRLLETLIAEKVEDVEIVINDGSDNCESKYLINKYLDNLPIVYSERIGCSIDAGIIELVEASSGKYIWFMGDDDIVVGGVLKVLDVMRANDQIDYIFINANNMRKSVNSIKLIGGHFFKGRDDLLLGAGTGLAFISSSVVKSCLAKKSLSYAKKFKGTDFVNFGIVMHVISNSENFYFLKDHIVIAYPHDSDEIKRRVTKSNGVLENNFFNIFGITWKKIVEDCAHAFNYKTVRIINKEVFGTTWRGVLVGAMGGWDTPKGKRLEMLRVFKRYPEVWIAVILFFVPVPILKHMHSAYKYLHRK